MLLHPFANLTGLLLLCIELPLVGHLWFAVSICKLPPGMLSICYNRRWCSLTNLLFTEQTEPKYTNILENCLHYRGKRIRKPDSGSYLTPNWCMTRVSHSAFWASDFAQPSQPQHPMARERMCRGLNSPGLVFLPT